VLTGRREETMEVAVDGFLDEIEKRV